MSNSPPVANNDNRSVAEFHSVGDNVLGNDSDPDGDILHVAGIVDGTVLQGAHGSLTLNANGSFSYTAESSAAIAVGATATDAFTYMAEDPHGATSNSATLTITITGGDTGDANDNHLLAAAGGSTLNGEGGNDTLDGSGNQDTLYGGTGHDILNGNGGNDFLYGGDTSGVNPSGTNDQIYGGDGDDFIHGGFSGLVDGGAGKDTLEDDGNGGNTTFYGGGDNDTITAVGGVDQVYGGTGDDVCRVGVVDGINGTVVLDPVAGETWDGGDGKDTLSLVLGAVSGQTNYTIDLTHTGISHFEIFNVAAVPFPEQNYTFTFKMDAAQFSQFQQISFPSGLHHIFEIVDGGTVTLPGTMGNFDRIVLDQPTHLDAAPLTTAGIVQIACGDGVDLVLDSNLSSGDFNSFAVLLGGGNDAFGSTSAGGGDGAAQVLGQGGNDFITGGSHDDQFDGGAGLDTIIGGGGNDQIIGGLGADKLTGGTGADTFIFETLADSPGKGKHDTITDFHHAEGDKIDVTELETALHKHLRFVDHAIVGRGHKGVLGFDTKHHLLELDNNGDGKLDFEVTLSHVAHLGKSDFHF